jgi:hypothetical protein
MKKPNGILPGIKRELVSEQAVGPEFEIKDSKGKAHKAQEVTRTEKEIDSRNLVKIAPMFYFCKDNNKVLLIPFSIQFSATEILKLVAGLATNLEKELQKLSTSEKKDQTK